MKIDSGKNGFVGIVISESNVFENDFAGYVFNGSCVGRIGDFRFNVHNFIKTLDSGEALHKGFGKLGKAGNGV